MANLMMSTVSPPSLEDLMEYARAIAATDRLPDDDIRPVLFGLFGEVGSVMTLIKKCHREDIDLERPTLVEDFGDILWYFVTLCRRLNVPLAAVVHGHGNDALCSAEDKMALTDHRGIITELSAAIERLGVSVAAMLPVATVSESTPSLQRQFWGDYYRCLIAARMCVGDVIPGNLEKTQGRFLAPTSADLPTFDSMYPASERLPMFFEIEFVENPVGTVSLLWNGKKLGDTLSDSIMQPDDYRFHDIFHLAYAAVLHWSPTFRKLAGLKRRSQPAVDEGQDGGRAIVIEEGVAAWIFSEAKCRAYFGGHKELPFDLLKRIRQVVTGFEVEACPYALWERAVLDGFRVFRAMVRNRGGVVVGDRNTRRIAYEER